MSIHQSELHRQASHYAAIKAKLYGRPANTNIKTKPVVEVKPEELPKPEAHVQAVETPPRIVFKPKKRIPTNMWEKARITFNQHVIDYRMYQFRQEMIASGDVSEDDIHADYEPFVDIPAGRKPILDIVHEVLEQFPGITVAQLKGKSRASQHVLPRHHAIYEIRRQRPDVSFPQIGRWFGGMDHTSCLYAYRKIGAQKQKELQEKA